MFPRKEGSYTHPVLASNKLPEPKYLEVQLHGAYFKSLGWYLRLGFVSAELALEDFINYGAYWGRDRDGIEGMPAHTYG